MYTAAYLRRICIRNAYYYRRYLSPFLFRIRTGAYMATFHFYLFFRLDSGIAMETHIMANGFLFSKYSRI